jgi:hypothetical protein
LLCSSVFIDTFDHFFDQFEVILFLICWLATILTRREISVWNWVKLFTSSTFLIPFLELLSSLMLWFNEHHTVFISTI